MLHQNQNHVNPYEIIKPAKGAAEKRAELREVITAIFDRYEVERPAAREMVRGPSCRAGPSPGSRFQSTVAADELRAASHRHQDAQRAGRSAGRKEGKR